MVNLQDRKLKVAHFITQRREIRKKSISSIRLTPITQDGTIPSYGIKGFIRETTLQYKLGRTLNLENGTTTKLRTHRKDSDSLSQGV